MFIPQTVEPVFPIVGNQPEIGRRLLRSWIPAVSALRRLIESGGLISYGPSIFDAARRMANSVDRIPRGANLADLPVEQASKIGLMITVKIARLFAIEVRQILLARADELIE